MKKEVIKYSKLLIGLIYCALGVVTILNSNLGLSPWDVLNQGLHNHLGITLGQANLLVGAVVVAFTFCLKQPIGSGTIINFLLVGVVIDIIIYLDIIPKGELFLEKITILTVGVIIFSYGCYLYISTGLGCGPRDGLMVILTKKTQFEVWKIKTIIEFIVLTLGFFLGGTVGIGTVISSLVVGPLIQFFFKLNRKDIKEIQHRNILTEIKSVRNLIIKD